MDRKYIKTLSRIVITSILFIIMLLVSKLWNISFKNNYLELAIYICIYLIIGYDILYDAIKNLASKNFLDENFLMSIASICAFFVAEYSEAIAVMLLYQIGELFQKIAVGKSRKSISDLIDICPEYTRVVNNLDGDNEEEVYSEEVEMGSYIIIKPGERIPLDCVINKGTSYVDTSALTGESRHRQVSVGDELLSGYINIEGVLIATTTKEYDDSTATKILELVESASDRKSKSENFITKFAKYYTPIVVIMALIIAIVPPILGILTFKEWIGRACIFLITSCPCALVISVPLSFFGGIGAASRKGILVKGSNYLEQLANVDSVLFDKTGTLTKGNFKVVNEVIRKDDNGKEVIDKEQFYKLLYIAEKDSKHPIAKAIISYIKEVNNSKDNNRDDCNSNDNNIYENDVYDIENVSEIIGKGMRVDTKDGYILVGNGILMRENNVNNYIESKENVTIIHVAYNDEYIGYVNITDEVKEFSKELIDKLNRKGIFNTIMLTGDKDATGQSIAKELGLSKAYTELLPEDKLNIIERIINEKESKGNIIYVGDGINDAPVLARADVGISMGGISSDAAIEASDIVLMDDNLLKIIDVLNISSKTMKIVYENIIISLAIKAIVLILGIFGLAGMWLAIFADVGVMVIAIFNSMRMILLEQR